ncbi:hypothetical protein OO013_18375 [Mangrovivirga sp. M17]|uniref:DUF2029 domain-containing protein n=1 Tax=Mangrovivirga halotolerans TaxID=2993936 RepID=A0ABT3RWW4_9BACT|nr:hypothetical protein [Mangrovivirga halotolerans]MCX2745854.1 hypothetical protein [Mangrovivirga halotolerans]
MHKRAFLLILFAALIFLINNMYLGGYLHSIETLSIELMTSPEALTEFRITNVEPFKFRIVFQQLVKYTSSIINPQSADVFYFTYLSYSLLFFVVSILAYYLLFFTITRDKKTSFFASIFILLSPFYLMAFSIPVHTREDTLAYSLICFGLVALLKNKYNLLILIIIIATATRETTMVLPLVILFFPGYSIFKRVFPLVISFIVFFAIRLVLAKSGSSLDNQIDTGFFYNLNHKISSIAFPIICFHILWVYYFMMIKIKNLKIVSVSQWLNLSSIVVLLIVSLTTVVFGRLNEIRLLAISAPWIMAVILISKEKWWIIPGKTAIIISYISCTLIGIIVAAILQEQELFLQMKKYYVPYSEWTAIFISYGLILTIGILKLILSYRHEYQKVN